MVCKNFRGAVMILATLLSMIASNIQAADETETSTQGNTYWEKSSPDKKMTLTRRMALVGHNCMVSRTAGGISVGTGTANLKYLCDDDLSNHFTVPSVADVSLLYGSPIVGVKDMKHYFSKETKAGFKISGQSDVLKLSVLQANYQINFYKDGKFLKTSEVEQLGFTVLDLNVGDINLGSDAVDVVAKDQPDEEYDEIALVGKSGIDLSVVKGLEIYYAFVGDAEYSLTNTRIKDYDPNITVQGYNSGTKESNLCNDNLKDETVISALIQLGSSGSASVKATNSEKPDEEVFPEGTEIGFVYNVTAVLSVAPTPTIFLYDKDGNKVFEKAVNSTVLSVSLGNKDQKISIKAPCAFSEAKMMCFGVQALSGIGVKYAFIVPEPISAGHQCEMSPNASLSVCNCDAKYKLTWDQTDFPNATWSMVSCTTTKDGQNKVDETNNVTFDPTTNMLDFGKTDAYKDDETQYGIDVVMRLTNTDGCHQDITIHYGGKESDQAASKKDEYILTNTDDANPEYTLGDGTDIGVDILKFVKNSKNILTSSLSDYATYIGGITLGSTYLCSIKKKDGYISDGSKAVQAGFVTTAKGSGLSADVLKLMSVKIYKDGEEVGSQINVDAISAKLIGSEDTHKVRYNINVPAGTAFDEIRLYSNGLLSANLSAMNIYYAYTADAKAKLDYPAEDATIISFNNTGASIDADKTLFAAGVNIGNGATDIANCIDGNLGSDDKEATYTLLPVTQVAGANILGINLGQTATKNKQLLIAIDKDELGLAVTLANAMQVKTYKSGVYEDDGKTPKAIETYSDWSVLAANVITGGKLGYVTITPKEDYDAVTITSGNGANVLKGLKIYGLLLLNDKNADGVVDGGDDGCKDVEDIVFDETKNPNDKTKSYKDGITMYFKRTFVSPKADGATGAWNSLVLPVTLTKAQFHKAFGNDAKLAKADKLYETTIDKVEHRIIGFKMVDEPTNDGDDMLISDEPYIIWLSKEFVDAHKNSTETYTTWDEGADNPISGEIYIVDKADGGVTYTKANARTMDFDIATPLQNEWKVYRMDMFGSYNPHQELKVDDYIFNNGDLYHLTSTHWMKGFRCWLRPDRTEESGSNAKEFSLGISDGETTRIVGITNVPSAKSGKVYNLNGQEIDALTGVQPGIYIVNGKKVVIR